MHCVHRTITVYLYRDDVSCIIPKLLLNRDLKPCVMEIFLPANHYTKLFQ